jgi:hypothetical protein
MSMILAMASLPTPATTEPKMEVTARRPCWLKEEVT